MAESEAQQFARGINDAIRALRGLYGGARLMLTELATELVREPTPLYDSRVRARPRSTKADPDERFLRSWEGRVYLLDPDEEDDEEDLEEEAEDGEDSDNEGPSQKKTVELDRGADVAFAKITFHHKDTGVEPHLLCGLLRNLRVAADMPTLSVSRGEFRKIIDGLRYDTKVGRVDTKASVKRPPDVPKKSKSAKRAYRLQFEVTEQFLRFPLFEINGPDKVREIAAAMKALAKD